MHKSIRTVCEEEKTRLNCFRRSLERRRDIIARFKKNKSSDGGADWDWWGRGRRAKGEVVGGREGHASAEE